MKQFGYNSGPNTPALGKYRVVASGWPGFPEIDGGGNIVGEMTIPGETIVELVWTDGPINGYIVVPMTATNWDKDERLTISQADLLRYTEPGPITDAGSSSVRETP